MLALEPGKRGLNHLSPPLLFGPGKEKSRPSSCHDGKVNKKKEQGHQKKEGSSCTDSINMQIHKTLSEMRGTSRFRLGAKCPHRFSEFPLLHY